MFSFAVSDSGGELIDWALPIPAVAIVLSKGQAPVLHLVVIGVPQRICVLVVVERQCVDDGHLLGLGVD